jgi:hypothetical protein
MAGVFVQAAVAAGKASPSLLAAQPSAAQPSRGVSLRGAKALSFGAKRSSRPRHCEERKRRGNPGLHTAAPPSPPSSLHGVQASAAPSLRGAKRRSNPESYRVVATCKALKKQKISAGPTVIEILYIKLKQLFERCEALCRRIFFGHTPILCIVKSS